MYSNFDVPHILNLLKFLYNFEEMIDCMLLCHCQSDGFTRRDVTHDTTRDGAKVKVRDYQCNVDDFFLSWSGRWSYFWKSILKCKIRQKDKFCFLIKKAIIIHLIFIHLVHWSSCSGVIAIFENWYEKLLINIVQQN